MSYKIALAGNPNSGKTTVFNILCGAREKVGNWPGTTVEKKEGIFTYRDETFNVVDLPGIYSLSAYSIDEKIARDFLINDKPDLVVCVIDASNLERNLYLLVQLLELGQKVLLDLNMIDIVREREILIEVDKLSKILGVDIVETIASKGYGIDVLKEKIVQNVKDGKTEAVFKIDYGELESAIEEISSILEDAGINLNIPVRSVAIKLLEGDNETLEEIKGYNLFSKIESIINNISTDVLNRTSDDLETIIIEKRYAYLKGLVRECVKRKRSLESSLTLSDKIDKIVTNRFLGIPLFLFFMYLLFQLVFKVGTPISDLIDKVFSSLANWIETLPMPLTIRSLLANGLISGVGSVLVFLPNIILLFLGIGFLEDSGYLARAAFVMDRFMHSLGLHGKSFIPMLLGFGCNIPGVMATRTLESEKDRILTILVIPLMSCSARLPIYTLFASAFFPKHQGLVVFSMYLLGIILAILVARVFKRIFFREELAPLVMELPPYRLPVLRNMFVSVWIRSSLFVKKAGTVILLVVLLVWILSYFPLGVEYASSESLIGRIGRFIAPIFKPAGFGSWRAGVSLIFGILAKESVVGTLGTLYGADEEGIKEALLRDFTPLSAYAFLIMSLIYIPCVATIAVIRRETTRKWALISLAYSFILGWSLSVIFYQIGRLLISL